MVWFLHLISGVSESSEVTLILGMDFSSTRNLAALNFPNLLAHELAATVLSEVQRTVVQMSAQGLSLRNFGIRYHPRYPTS